MENKVVLVLVDGMRPEIKFPYLIQQNETQIAA